MSIKDDNYLSILGLCTFTAALTAKTVFDVRIRYIFLAAFIIGLTISVLAEKYGIKEVHTQYQAGKREFENGEIQVLKFNIPVHYDWYSPVLVIQTFLMPAQALLGCLVGLTVKAVIC